MTLERKILTKTEQNDLRRFRRTAKQRGKIASVRLVKKNHFVKITFKNGKTRFVPTEQLFLR